MPKAIAERVELARELASKVFSDSGIRMTDIDPGLRTIGLAYLTAAILKEMGKDDWPE